MDVDGNPLLNMPKHRYDRVFESELGTTNVNDICFNDKIVIIERAL